jgi:putative tryptophan/tyrosine transport system substrate-binding protein
MRRIGLAVVLALNLTLAPLLAEAQQEKVHRLGLLTVLSPPAQGNPPGPFSIARRDLGYVEGRNIVFDRRWAEGRNERFSNLAIELVALKPDVIVADTTAGLLAAKRARRPSLLSWSGPPTR